MVDQATRVERNGGGPSHADGSTREAGVATLAADVLRLAQLQAMLTVAESRDAVRKLFLPAAFLVAGAALGLGCVPVLVVALASVFVAAGMLWPPALLLAAVIGLIVAALLVWGGLAGLRRSLAGLARSQQELAENMESIRRAFSGDGSRSD